MELANNKAGLAHWQDRIMSGDKLAFLLFIIVITGLYLLTSAGNFSETDDVYAFAYRTENFLYSHVSDPRLMLYHMSMRAIYLATNGLLTPLGVEVSGLACMRMFSAICGAITLWLMIKILRKDFKLSTNTAWLGAAFLSVSYGFWRYAAEAEVYIPATMLCLLVFHLMLAERFQHLLAMLLIGALSGLIVLFYQPSVIPLFFAFPFLILYRDKLLHVLAYGLTGVFVVIAGYLAGFFLFWTEPLSLDSFLAFLSQRAGEFMIPSMSIKTVIVSILRSGLALSHDFISANWVFAFQPALDFVARVFPGNVIIEEVFLAKQVGAWLYLLFITHILLAIAIVYLLFKNSLNIKKIEITRPFVVIVIWVLINGAIIGRLNPAGIEAWIMLLAPLLILVSVCIFEPITKGKITSKILPVLLISLLFHNFFGGMKLVFDPGYEYHRVKGNWVIENATENDLVLIAGDAGFVETLRYLSKANVVYTQLQTKAEITEGLLSLKLNELRTLTHGRDFKGDSVAQKITAAWKNGGRVIVFEDFFYPLTLQTMARSWKLKKISKNVYRVPDYFATALKRSSTYIVPSPEQR